MVQKLIYSEHNPDRNKVSCKIYLETKVLLVWYKYEETVLDMENSDSDSSAVEEKHIYHFSEKITLQC